MGTGNECVNRLYILDYLFIVAGVLLFFSLNAVLLKKFEETPPLQIIPKVGLLLTILSRTSDACENLWTILIYSNPLTFNLVLLQILRAIGWIKWFFVALEYTTMGIGWIVVLFLAIQKQRKKS